MADTPGSSTKASDAAAKRETLTSRAKRIIGRALETPRDNKDSDKRGPPKKASTKRREQVLQAQRTHRQRTQGYIKELEKEVLRLRDVQSSLKRENAVLAAKAKILEQTLLVNNITVPDLTAVGATSQVLGNGFSNLDLNSDFNESLSLNESAFNSPSPGNAMSDSDTAWSTISGHTPAIPGGYVNVDLTSLQSMPGIHIENHSVEEDIIVPISKAELEAHPHKIVFASPGATTLDTQEALDFVLGVEKVCFGHLKYTYLENGARSNTIPDDNFGEGHAYMAVTNLMNQKSRGIDPTAKPFQMPAVDLKKMFNATLSLDFGSDVTPIQIWFNLSRLVAKGYLIDREFLRLLMDEFAKYSRCNGYGAVVERDTANSIITYYFPGECYLDPAGPDQAM